MVVEEQTKKEQIINLAQNDPFLKISDIAAYVKTTPRYVRTILSEANISLMKLRKRYARSMERRLRLQDEERKGLPLSLMDDKGWFTRGEMELQHFQDEGQGDSEGETLCRISQINYLQEKPHSLHEMIVGEEYLKQDALQNQSTIYQLLKIPEEPLFHPSTIWIQKTQDPWTRDLSLEDDDLVIVVKRSLFQDEERVAQEQFILDARVLESILHGRLVV